MRIILICFLVGSSLSAQALEWNQKAFQQSLNEYKKNLEGWSENPKQALTDLKNKYQPSLDSVKAGFEKIKHPTKIEAVQEYYNFFEGKYKKYSSVNNRDLFNMFSQDVSQTFNWAYQNMDSAPIVGPYKRDIQIRVDMLKFQLVPYRYLIQGALERSI